MTAALVVFFHRDRMASTMDSTVTQSQEPFDSFRAALDEVIEARIDSGLHLRHSMLDGAQVGHQVARWVVIHNFRSDR